MGDGKKARTWITYVIATVAGVAMLVVSFHFNGSAYADSASAQWWAGVLSNSGAAVIFVVPLYFITRSLDRHVEAVRVEGAEGVKAVRVEAAEGVEALAERVSDFQAEVDERLEAVAHSVSARLRAEQEADAQAFDAMAAEPSRPNVIRALITAYDLELIKQPPRVGVSEREDLFIAFELVGDEDPSVVHLKIILQARDGTELDVVWWREDDLVEDVMVTLGRRVQAKAGPLVDLDVEALFKGLADLLRVAASSAERRPLVQLCPPQWAVTDGGVVSYGPHTPMYQISADRLRDEEHWTGHMTEKSWVDSESFEDARRAAVSLLRKRDSLFWKDKDEE